MHLTECVNSLFGNNEFNIADCKLIRNKLNEIMKFYLAERKKKAEGRKALDSKLSLFAGLIYTL